MLVIERLLLVGHTTLEMDDGTSAACDYASGMTRVTWYYSYQYHALQVVPLNDYENKDCREVTELSTGLPLICLSVSFNILNIILCLASALVIIQLIILIFCYVYACFISLVCYINE